MNYNIFYSIALSFLSLLTHAQTEVKSKGRPDLPGTFLLELGFNFPQTAPDKFDASFFGSRTFNVYYQHDIRIPILKSKFRIAPGIGFGFDRFKFNSNYTIAYESGDLTMSRINLDITKSQFITNYIDVPIELKYTKNPSNPDRSFKIAAGFRAGLLLNAFTKIKYDVENQGTYKDKSRNNWNVNTYRYGFYGKVGVGNFSFFGYYNMSTLFKNEEGPDESSINNLTVGISLAGF
jgi:Outer membrane protein beta-barrel domain